MTAELDPIRFKTDLSDVLARYITTAAPVSSARAPRLSNAIAEACAKAGLVKGPFVESLPDFEKGGSIAQLVEEGVLHETWTKLTSTDEGRRLFERPLHLHQTATIGRDENYLVATGTGSGKTESFLFPLVDDLLRQGNLERPGVRVILVYPLKQHWPTDQMHRIARLLFRDLCDPGITLGRFTGQVRSNATRGDEEPRLIATPTFHNNFPERGKGPAQLASVARGNARAPLPISSSPTMPCSSTSSCCLETGHCWTELRSAGSCWMKSIPTRGLRRSKSLSCCEN